MGSQLSPTSPSGGFSQPLDVILTRAARSQTFQSAESGAGAAALALHRNPSGGSSQVVGTHEDGVVLSDGQMRGGLTYYDDAEVPDEDMDALCRICEEVGFAIHLFVLVTMGCLSRAFPLVRFLLCILSSTAVFLSGSLVYSLLRLCSLCRSTSWRVIRWCVPQRHRRNSRQRHARSVCERYCFFPLCLFFP